MWKMEKSIFETNYNSSFGDLSANENNDKLSGGGFMGGACWWEWLLVLIIIVFGFIFIICVFVALDIHEKETKQRKKDNTVYTYVLEQLTRKLKDSNYQIPNISSYVGDITSNELIEDVELNLQRSGISLYSVFGVNPLGQDNKEAFYNDFGEYIGEEPCCVYT